MLQSRVEIEHYSVAYFDTLLHLKRCSSELPLRAELVPATYNYQVFMSLGCAYEPPPPLNGSSGLQCFECGIAVEIHNGSISTRTATYLIILYLPTLQVLTTLFMLDCFCYLCTIKQSLVSSPSVCASQQEIIW